MHSRSRKKGRSLKKTLPFALRQRLAYIEEVLFWTGEAARLHLRDYFQISPQRAALDFAVYRKLHPSNLRYDAAIKRYIPSSEFSPHYYSPELERALFRWSAVEAVPRFHRPWDVNTVRNLVLAIRRRRRCRVLYHSLKSETTSYREVSPHTFVDDGARWHVRAFDHTTSKWCDLVLGRIEKAKMIDAKARPAIEDADWTSFVSFQAIPSRNLAPAARKALARDYGAIRDVLTIRIRNALSFYAAENLGLLRFPRSRWEASSASKPLLPRLHSGARAIE